MISDVTAIILVAVCALWLVARVVIRLRRGKGGCDCGDGGCSAQPRKP